MEDNGSPHNPVVSIKESMACNLSTIFIDDTNKQGWEERVKRQLDIPRPHRRWSRRVLEHLFKVHTRKSRHSRSDKDRRQTNGVIHIDRARVGKLVLLDPLVGRRALGQVVVDLACAVSRLTELMRGAREVVVRAIVEEELVVERGAGLGEGGDCDPDRQQDQGEPSRHADGAAEKSGGEDGSREDLERERALEVSRVISSFGGLESS